MFGRQRNRQNPGRYDRLLELQPSTEAQGVGADSQPSWNSSQVIPVHGAWMHSALASKVIAESRFPEANGVWEIPYLPTVDETFRVLSEGVYYRILGIDDVGKRHRELRLFCVDSEGAIGV